MPEPEMSTVVVSPPTGSSTPRTVTSRKASMRTNSRRWIRSTSPESAMLSEPLRSAVSRPG